jgi:hypothetical protein
VAVPRLLVVVAIPPVAVLPPLPNFPAVPAATESPGLASRGLDPFEQARGIARSKVRRKIFMLVAS